MTTALDRRRQALTFFIGRGWSPQQAAGIVANLEAESGLNPAAVGDGGQAYGIAQWHPDRQAHFPGLIGKDIHGSSISDQLAFVHAELVNFEKAAGDALRACATASEAGACVSKKYERPADREGEATRRAALAQTIFVDYGGTTDQPLNVHATSTEKPMGALALLQMFAPILSGMIPQIQPLLAPGTDKTAKLAGIAQVVLDTINRTTGEPNLQGSLEAMQSSPAVKAAVQAAVITHPEVIGLMEVGGGITAAAERDVVAVAADNSFLRSPAFWVTMLVFLPPIDFTIYKVVSQMTEPSETLITQVVTSIVGLLSVVAAFYLGSSFGSMRKTELAATATEQAVLK